MDIWLQIQTTKPITVTNYYKYDNQSFKMHNIGSIFNKFSWTSI